MERPYQSARDFCQRRKRWPRIALSQWLGQAHGIAAPDPGPEEHVLTEESRGRIWKAVQALSPPLRYSIQDFAAQIVALYAGGRNEGDLISELVFALSYRSMYTNLKVYHKARSSKMEVCWY